MEHNTSMTPHTTSAMIGGFLFTLISIPITNLITTIVLAILGTLTSFFTSILLKRFWKWVVGKFEKKK